jgi:NAD-dependent SIR2 family protein deacetylase
MKLKNEFMNVEVSKDKTRITLLDVKGKPQPCHTFVFTNTEFDNLCHLIEDNVDKIHKKICFEYSPKTMRLSGICGNCKVVRCKKRKAGLSYCDGGFR